jgi:hypothetical protein
VSETTFQQRLIINAPPEVAVMRKVRKPFKFSYGFEAPVGMKVSAHQYATHYDEKIYRHANVFDGFRFVQPSTSADDKKAGGDSGFKRTVYTISCSYLAFGHGRHGMSLGHSFFALGANHQPSQPWPVRIHRTQAHAGLPHRELRDEMA